MALSQNTHVYMETMEIAQNKEEKSDKNGNPWILCEHGGKLSKGTLVLCQSDDSQESHDKRKTDKQWLLWFSHSLSVCARQLLKAPYTERYVRCCERTAVSHRLLLDFQVFLHLISSGFLFSYTYNWKLTHRRVNKKISEPKYQNFPRACLKNILNCLF